MVLNLFSLISTQNQQEQFILKTFLFHNFPTSSLTRKTDLALAVLTSSTDNYPGL